MTVVLSGPEARILGSLVEKAATTPDNYPLSSNALRSACNQISNRDPVVDYEQRLIDAVMLDLRQRGLARTVHQAGGRVSKHRHVLDEALGLASDELAVLAVLLLRGPQTVAELISRTERYAGGPVGMAGVESVIDRLSTGRIDGLPLVARLARRVGEREPRVTHLLYDPEEAPPGARTVLGEASGGPVTPLMATGHGAAHPTAAPAPTASSPVPVPSAAPVGPGVITSASAPPARVAPAPAMAPPDAPAVVGPPTSVGAPGPAGEPARTAAVTTPSVPAAAPATIPAPVPVEATPAGGALARELVELRRRVETLEAAYAEQAARLDRLVDELGG